jgi:Zn-dependent M28 family amino/carboxypeptidase
VLAAALACCALASGAGTPPAAAAHAFAVSLARAGPRPAGSAAERRAHQRVAVRMRAAGLRVGFERFGVPGHGSSRDVIAIRDAPSRCLVIAMAHADSVPPAPGADDNASGVGTLVALAAALGAGPAPACDTWLVATGSEERPYTGRPDHLGAAALVRRLRRTGRLRDVRLALSLDEVGRGRRFELRSPVASARAGVEGRILAAARRATVDVRWLRDTATGNSDHRELALAGAPAAKLGVPDEPCRHTACDTPDRLQRGAFERVLRVVWPLLRDWGT